MLIKENYILITPEENRKNNVNCRNLLTNMIDESVGINGCIGVVVGNKTIYDYEVWDLEKRDLSFNFCNGLLYETEKNKLRDIRNFLINNNLKYCYELKIKEE